MHEHQKTETSVKESFLTTPVAIIIAGALIATAVYLGMNNKTSEQIAQVPGQQVEEEEVVDLEKLAPVTKDDHVRGNLNAAVKIVEYSDTECPFCKRFHISMLEVMDQYKDEEVAWVYRHFPLDQLHPTARKEAEATECAAELGGNDKFWAYLDRLMEVTPGNNRFDLAELPKIATYVGLDADAFNKCLSSGKYANKIEEHVQNAVAIGGRGTPWSVVVGKGGKKYPLSGAQPVSAIKALIDLASK